MTRYPLNVYITGIGGLGLIGCCLVTIAAFYLGWPEVLDCSTLAEMQFACVGVVGIGIAAFRYYTDLFDRQRRDARRL